MAALALSILKDEPVRLTWCVDLNRDLTADAGTKDPTNVQANTQWGGYLRRFRGALDRLPNNGSRGELSLLIRHRLGPVGAAVLSQYAVPWMADYSTLTPGDPPVGTWRLLVPNPNRRDKEMNYDDWWDWIPF